MKITYVKHSCFTVELDSDRHVVLIFDYFDGELPEFPKDSFVCVFASHKHADHYNQKIFALAEMYDNIVFLLAKEIRMNEKYMERCNITLRARDRISYAHADREYYLVDGTVRNLSEISNVDCQDGSDRDGIYVKTYKSTDSGVAFLVRAEGRTVYHAGDLNWWKVDSHELQSDEDRKPEADEKAAARMEADFKKEVSLLAAEPVIDAAFLPLDGRLGKYAGLGFTYYMQECHIRQAYPMHMWESYELIDEYKSSSEAADFAERIAKITKQGESWEI